nr:MAG: hypothetical protein 1 [Leviviridae sp.]
MLKTTSLLAHAGTSLQGCLSESDSQEGLCMTTKTRTFYTGHVSGTSRSSIFGSLDPYDNWGPLSSEVSYSISHARLSGGRWSGGGPWRMERNVTYFEPTPPFKANYNAGGGYLGEGTIRIEYSTDGVPNLAVPTPPSNNSLNADATTAIARIEPTRPAFDLSVVLGELRAEGLPHLPGQALRDQTQLVKSAGGEYLNVEFGWMPLVRSVRQFADVVKRSDEITRSYQERANTVTRRSYEWPEAVEYAARNCNFSMNPPIGFFTGGSFTQRKFTRRWLEVDFTYYLPTGSTRGDKIRRYGAYARHLLGVELTPEVLWNLSPWSWAADWFSNTGDVMHNLSALGHDSLLMQNGYMMCHSGLESTSTGSYQNSWGPPLFQRRRQIEETKIRLQASPFGFGVALADFSSRQNAIIAALGASRFG